MTFGGEHSITPGCIEPFVKKYKKGTAVKLLVQPDDLEHDDKSSLKLEIIDNLINNKVQIFQIKIQKILNRISVNFIYIKIILIN